MKKTYEIIELELDDKLIDNLVVYALDKIKNDQQALIEYAVNDILEHVVNNEGEFKKIAEKYREEHKDEICPRCDFMMDKKCVEGINEEALVCPECNYSVDTHG